MQAIRKTCFGVDADRLEVQGLVGNALREVDVALDAEGDGENLFRHDPGFGERGNAGLQLERAARGGDAAVCIDAGIPAGGIEHRAGERVPKLLLDGLDLEHVVLKVVAGDDVGVGAVGHALEALLDAVEHGVEDVGWHCVVLSSQTVQVR